MPVPESKSIEPEASTTARIAEGTASVFHDSTVETTASAGCVGR